LLIDLQTYRFSAPASFDEGTLPAAAQRNVDRGSAKAATMDRLVLAIGRHRRATPSAPTSYSNDKAFFTIS
jgi:hypothetical protein